MMRTAVSGGGREALPPDSAERLLALEELRDLGVVSAAEFVAAVTRLRGRFTWGEFGGSAAASPTRASTSTAAMGDGARGQCYRLVLRGELGDRFAGEFEGMQLERVAGTTVLTGAVVDQAHLYGLLDRIPELGIELVSVEPVAGPCEQGGGG